MSKIIVLGGGIIGLSTAMLLGRQGHAVAVFEHDPTPLPDSPAAAWERWDRSGVAQFRQPHYLHPAARLLLDAHLPEVKQALLDAGCISFDVLSLMPPGIADRDKRPGDEQFITVTGRRTTLEFAVAKAATQVVDVQRGVSVVGLRTSQTATDGIPHVTGVRTTDGEHHADLVIDATGRRSHLPEWLAAIGARRPAESAEDAAFFYYTRHFRTLNGQAPRFRSGLLTNFHTFSLLTLPGDAGTWSVTVFLFSGDPVLKALRHPAYWTRLVEACPTVAHWLDGEPISDVLPMGGTSARARRFVVDDQPVATGVIAVGDAAICTNPAGGRGISMGLMHAAGTAEVVANYLDDPLALALEHDSMTRRRIEPWYAVSVDVDRARTAQIRAAIDGRPAPRPTGAAAALGVAMLYDATLFRAAMQIAGLLRLPSEVFAQPELLDRAIAIADLHPPAEAPGPSREALLQMLAA